MEDLQSQCEELLEATGADRVTVRLDWPTRGWQVDFVAAEAAGPGIAGLTGNGSLDQRNLETVKWLETHRRVLVQPAFRKPPFPPEALIDVYGVKAQILAPIEVRANLVGWVSVHSCVERAWSAADVEAALAATDRMAAGIGLRPAPVD